MLRGSDLYPGGKKLNMQETRNRLKDYMGKHDLSIKAVAKLLDRHPLTIWKFLNGKTSKPHDQTIYKIEKLTQSGR